MKVEGSGERSFYRAAVFRGPYPSGACDYRDAARKVYAAVFKMPQVLGWRTSDDPPKGYDLYCYPAKILSSMIRALCRHAKAEPKDSADALAIALCHHYESTKPVSTAKGKGGWEAFLKDHPERVK